MKRNNKVLLVTLLIAIMSLMIAGIASAQEDDTTERPNRPIRDPIGNHAEIMKTITEATGLELAEIVTAMRDGQTLGEVIEANGGDLTVITDELIAQATERINTAVEAGNIDQERADELLADLDTRFADILSGESPLGGLRDRLNDRRSGRENRPGPGGNRAPGGRVRDAFGGVIVDSLSELEIDGAAVMEAVRDGQTFSEALEANGVDADAFISDVTAKVEAQLAERVADGSITQEQADTVLERLNDLFTNGFSRRGRV